MFTCCAPCGYNMQYNVIILSLGNYYKFLNVLYITNNFLY